MTNLRVLRFRAGESDVARVFITGAMFEESVARLAEAGHEVVYRNEANPIPREALLNGVRSADALVCLMSDRIDEELLDAGAKLRIVANVAAGHENVDLEATRRRGIVATHTPDVLTEATADLTMALVLATARRVVEGDRAVRAGRFGAWGLVQPLMGSDVYGKVLGIVGMGRIGSAVARRAQCGFGMRILYHNRTPIAPPSHGFEATWVSFDELLQESDFVCVHVPLTEETRHLFGAREFARMKPSAFLINVARGAVVDEEALVRALAERQIAGAGLDVYEHEPEVHPQLLERSERVVLAPHMGSATEATRRGMVRIAIDNVLAVLSGNEPVTPIVG